MPRYSDQWVMDKTLYVFLDLENGGSCACCGIPYMFNPGGLKGLVEACTDLEDAKDQEFESAEQSPWPPAIRDQIWADRVSLRLRLKKEMKHYQDFLQTIAADASYTDTNSNSITKEKLKQFLQTLNLQQIFQLSRSEIDDKVKHHYNIHSAYGVVLNTVMEQVAFFPLTKYEPDGNSPSEILFEKTLAFNRRAGLHIPIVDSSNAINENVLDMFVDLFLSLAGPKLLPRKNLDSTSNHNTMNDNDDDDHDIRSSKKSAASSFRADRRLVRLLIVRYWSDQIISKYKQQAAAAAAALEYGDSKTA